MGDVQLPLWQISYSKHLFPAKKSTYLVAVASSYEFIIYFLKRRAPKPIIPNAKIANVDGSGTDILDIMTLSKDVNPK